jgi:hypothetical protein
VIGCCVVNTEDDHRPILKGEFVTKIFATSTYMAFHTDNMGDLQTVVKSEQGGFLQQKRPISTNAESVIWGEKTTATVDKRAARRHHATRIRWRSLH